MKIKAQIKLKGTSECSLIHSRQVFSKLNQGLFSPKLWNSIKVEVSAPPRASCSWAYRGTPGRVFPINSTGVSLAATCGHCLSSSCCAPLKKAWLHLLSNPTRKQKIAIQSPSVFSPQNNTNPVPSASWPLPTPAIAVAFTGLAPVWQSLTMNTEFQMQHWDYSVDVTWFNTELDIKN